MPWATFNPPHNHVKSKALIYLWHRWKQGKAAVTLYQLVNETNLNYSTLKSALGRWSRWKYIVRHLSNDRGRLVFRYRISQRGVRFVVTRVPRYLFNKCFSELLEIQQSRRG